MEDKWNPAIIFPQNTYHQFHIICVYIYFHEFN